MFLKTFRGIQIVVLGPDKKYVLSMITMTVFSGYVFYILNFDPNIPCSCGGILDSMGWTEHLIFNVAFLVLSVLGIALESKMNQNKNYATGNQ